MQPANMRDFVAAVKQSLHVDMSADIGTYICQDKAKPLACLLS
ncbi:hypothetical protein [Thermosporothrix hazakensis]|jgi:hypothetical protein|nr:hypothetical protein [Thermosporothrix hazakensis]